MREAIAAGSPADLGRAVQEARTAKGWTQAEAAKKAGVSRRWLIELEHGHHNAQLAKVMVVLRTLDLEMALVHKPLVERNELDDLVEGL